jgi:hypothetical protein
MHTCIRTCMTYGVTYGPQTRFLYRLITQEPAINLIHRDPSYPRAYTFARENNNRHKLSAKIALVLHDLGSLVSSRRFAPDGFRRIQTRADRRGGGGGGGGRFNGFTATYPLRTRQLYYARFHMAPCSPRLP